MKTQSKKRLLSAILALFFIFQFPLFSQVKEPSAADRGMASEDFRRGVISYYRGAYGDAIMQFEKALSYLPDEGQILEWLGKSYLKFGVESAALDQWKYAIDNGYGGIVLQNKYEIVQSRRIAFEQFSKDTRYLIGASFPGVMDDTFLFSKVFSILPEDDGSFWATAYGSNELLKFDINGAIIDRTQGPLNGFDRPMDLIRLSNGNMAITESKGDRISVLDKKGRYLFSFGESGIKDGQFLGPQCIAQGNGGNLYVTDYGNKRISVFTENGEFLFSFQGKFKSPTGIAIKGDSIYVADAVVGDITIYDFAGNYTGCLCKAGTFKYPESLRIYGNSMLVADKNKIYSVDLSNSKVFETVKIGNTPSKLTCAVVDVNGNLIAPDFNENEIEILSKMNELVGGFYVDIIRVNADTFPNVTVDVKVENRYRQDVIGLKETNFFFSENGGMVKNLKYHGMVGYNYNSDITIVIDFGTDIDKYSVQVEEAVRQIAKNMDPSSTLTIISSGEIPTIEYSGSGTGCEKFSFSRLNAKKSSESFLELSLRLAANNMISTSSKKGIILLTDGNVDENSFTKYPLADVCSYLSNNDINFSAVLLSDMVPDYQIDYLESHLKGKTYYLYQSEGISSIVSDFNSINDGIYRFSFTSVMNAEYGRAFLPVEVEVYLHNRSGKDISGYFAPLD